MEIGNIDFNWAFDDSSDLIAFVNLEIKNWDSDSGSKDFIKTIPLYWDENDGDVQTFGFSKLGIKVIITKTQNNFTTAILKNGVEVLKMVAEKPESFQREIPIQAFNSDPNSDFI